MHEDLVAQIEQTVYLAKEHQKIVIIDRNLTFIGSMNVLAHVPGSRHEVMALFQSAALADQLLKHERADQLKQPPACAHGTSLADPGTERGKNDWEQVGNAPYDRTHAEL